MLLLPGYCFAKKKCKILFTVLLITLSMRQYFLYLMELIIFIFFKKHLVNARVNIN